MQRALLKSIIQLFPHFSQIHQQTLGRKSSRILVAVKVKVGQFLIADYRVLDRLENRFRDYCTIIAWTLKAVKRKKLYSSYHLDILSLWFSKMSKSFK